MVEAQALRYQPRASLASRPFLGVQPHACSACLHVCMCIFYFVSFGTSCAGNESLLNKQTVAPESRPPVPIARRQLPQVGLELMILCFSLLSSLSPPPQPWFYLLCTYVLCAIVVLTCADKDLFGKCVLNLYVLMFHLETLGTDWLCES